MTKNTLKNKAIRGGRVTKPLMTTYWKNSRYCIFGAMMIFSYSFPTRAIPSQDLSQICDQAAVFAAQKTGVPISVLQAISLTETGRKRSGEMRPWPWTVNMEGKGVWFDSEDDARAYVYKNYKRGARSFDVGCFQINYKWHGQEFASIEEMFEPNPNALYAANFLLKLYREKGDWSEAAGAYHSRTQKYAEKYEKRFNEFRTALLNNNANLPPTKPTGVVAPQALAQQKARVNQYPLLQTTNKPQMLGSLVPLGSDQSPRRLIDIGGDGG